MNATNNELIEFAKDQCEIFPEDSHMGKYLRETMKMLRAESYEDVPDTNVGNKMQKESCEDAVSRSSVFEIMGNLMSIPYDLDRPINKKDVSDSMGEIRALPPVKPTRKERMQGSVLDKMKAEIREWYWDADKQALAKDPCVVDAMVDLFIRTINKYKAEKESE